MAESPPEGSITLIPSVHVSAKRIDAVKAELVDLDPDIIAVELDEARFNALTSKSGSPHRLLDVYNTMSVPTATVYLLLGVVQLAMARLTGVSDGSDMTASIRTARDLDVPVALVDADLQPIFEDIVARALDSPLDKAIDVLSGDVGQLSDVHGLTSFISSSDIDQSEIDESIEQFRTAAPYAAHRLIDERNEYMASRLWTLKQKGYDVAAVVGAGHVSGMEELLQKYEEEPPESVTVPLRVPRVATEE